MLTIGQVRLATNQISVELHHDKLADKPLWLDFADHGGTLTAGITPAEWLDNVPPEEQQSLRFALSVLFQLAGVAEGGPATPRSARIWAA